MMLVMFVCRHCGGTMFRLLTGINGRTAAECLSCGKPSSFDQSSQRKQQPLVKAHLGEG